MSAGKTKKTRPITIAKERQELLQSCATLIADVLVKKGSANLLFVCTHNSRRSMMAQVLAATYVAERGLKNIHCFSGGTESTAFNIRAVAALDRAGFVVETEDANHDNPHYLVMLPGDERLICFSKTYNDPINPKENLLAIMVCDDAAEACPNVPGALARFSITYTDPKRYDDQEEESHQYDYTCQLIGAEMAFMVNQVAAQLTD